LSTSSLATRGVRFPEQVTTGIESNRLCAEEQSEGLKSEIKEFPSWPNAPDSLFILLLNAA
jgi:hypothetical protein